VTAACFGIAAPADDGSVSPASLPWPVCAHAEPNDDAALPDAARIGAERFSSTDAGLPTGSS
jgi:hypothetical protein